MTAPTTFEHDIALGIIDHAQRDRRFSLGVPKQKTSWLRLSINVNSQGERKRIKKDVAARGINITWVEHNIVQYDL